MGFQGSGWAALETLQTLRAQVVVYPGDEGGEVVHGSFRADQDTATATRALRFVNLYMHSSPPKQGSALLRNKKSV